MRSVTKSRNGCARCKRQKVRCDQAKPGCGRCTRVGVECPGYTQQYKWSKKYEFLHQQNEPSSPTTSSTPLPIPSPGLGNIPFEDFFGIDMPDLMLPGFMLDSNINLSAVNSPKDDNQKSVPPTPVTNSNQTSQSTSLPTPVTADLDCLPPVNSPTPVTIIPEPPNDHASQTEETIEDLVSRPAEDLIVAPSFASATSGPLRRSLSDVATVLTEYYFKEAASLYSVYDSPMNPFRSTVSQLWESSRLLHCTLQSMSAACLLDNFPHLAEAGKELRKEAISILRNQHEHDHASLLALLMLGGSSSWHDTRKTGAEYFNLARRRLDQMVSTNQLPKDSNNYHFFEEALIYWELLLAYVDDDVLRAPEVEETSSNSIYFPSRHIPHPWTGVARDTQVTVQEVGRLVRRCRVISRSAQFTTTAHIEELQRNLELARRLESKLLTLVYPDERDVISPGDKFTPVWHLLTLAEVYRRTGLVQLYRVFPDLLDDRLRDQQVPYFDPSEWLVEPSISAPQKAREKRNEWLTSYVLETLRMLETIPVESGTRDFQPFLLVALCSELRLPRQHLNPDLEDEASPPFAPTDNDSFVPVFSSQNGNTSLNPIIPPELTIRSIEVVRTRQFIVDRLTSFLRILPPKPMHVCLDIAKASWGRIDQLQKLKPAARAHRQDVYWMDVMMDNSWETCMA